MINEPISTLKTNTVIAVIALSRLWAKIKMVVATRSTGVNISSSEPRTIKPRPLCDLSALTSEDGLCGKLKEGAVRVLNELPSAGLTLVWYWFKNNIMPIKTSRLLTETPICSTRLTSSSSLASGSFGLMPTTPVESSQPKPLLKQLQTST